MKDKKQQQRLCNLVVKKEEGIMAIWKPSLVIWVGGIGYRVLSLLIRQRNDISITSKAQETDGIQFLLLDILSEGFLILTDEPEKYFGKMERNGT
jgi:hypothetical protein